MVRPWRSGMMSPSIRASTRTGRSTAKAGSFGLMAPPILASSAMAKSRVWATAYGRMLGSIKVSGSTTARMARAVMTGPTVILRRASLCEISDKAKAFPSGRMANRLHATGKMDSNMVSGFTTVQLVIIALECGVLGPGLRGWTSAVTSCRSKMRWPPRDSTSGTTCHYHFSGPDRHHALLSPFLPFRLKHPSSFI